MPAPADMSIVVFVSSIYPPTNRTLPNSSTLPSPVITGLCGVPLRLKYADCGRVKFAVILSVTFAGTTNVG